MNDLVRLKIGLVQLGSALLDVLFPPRCVGCRRPGGWLCSACRNEIAFIKPPWCLRCGRPSVRGHPCAACRDTPFFLDGIRAVAYYEGVMRAAIHRFKYRNGRALVTPLGNLLIDYLAQYPLPADVVVPIPLHPRRLADRGYNQSALLAAHVSRALGWPSIENSLVRVRYTQPQVEQPSAEARRQNVQDAFVCRDDSLANARVLLIDDVYTTGATLQACGLALRQRGVQSVWALTLAHGR